MPYGYHGKILHLNLTNRTIEIEEPAEEFYRLFMGGSALGMHYVLQHTPPHADPLGPENTLVLALSVLTGTPISGQSRMTAVAKSPLTDAIGDSQSGGFWPAELKFAGFDAIVIRGQSAQPVYLWIHDGKVELRDASHLWGKITGDVEEQIKKELADDKVEILQCGPAGERGVRFAALMSMSNRANGRTGMGAVMGSKRLKAVVVRGKKRPLIANPDQFKSLARWGPANFPDSMVVGLGKYGTAEGVMSQQKSGGLPTNNWDSGVFDGAEGLDGVLLYDKFLRGAEEGKQDRLGRDTCYACTIRCKRVAEIKEGPFLADPQYGGPEYETIATFGSYCGVSDLTAVTRANQLCNQYGMDTISCGATIAWAFNCFADGLITTSDTGGVDLSYGNAASMVKLTELIGQRRGFGDILAEGSARAAEKIGRGTEANVVAVKKQEMPAHMPQVKRGIGLIYAVNPFGADHQSSEHDPTYESGFPYFQNRLVQLGLNEQQPPLSLTEDKIRFFVITQHLYSALDSLNICQFVFGPSWQLYGPEQLVNLVQAVTGWDVDLAELLRVGERRVNMLRMFNEREGFTRKNDDLPKKLTKELRGGNSDGLSYSIQELEDAKDQYYAFSGWDLSTGNPTTEKITEMSLSNYN
jgi:aldehyde:ferredoxin oxidoreductase